MPRYHQKDEFHFASHIPGPSHNTVGIRFVHTPCEPSLLRESRQSPYNRNLDEAKIKVEVLKGIAEANRNFDTSFYASEIKYYADDSARYQVYRICAYWLVGKLSGNIE